MRNAYKISVEKNIKGKNSLLGESGVVGRVINSALLGLYTWAGFDLLKLASGGRVT
jgi:hypothetical protein